MLAGVHIQVTIIALFVHLVECGTLLMITRFSLLLNVFLFFIFWMAVAFILLEFFFFGILFRVHNKLYSIVYGDY